MRKWVRNKYGDPEEDSVFSGPPQPIGLQSQGYYGLYEIIPDPPKPEEPLRERVERLEGQLERLISLVEKIVGLLEAPHEV